MMIEQNNAVVNLVDPDFIAAQTLASSDESPYESIQQLGQALQHNPPIFVHSGDPLLRQLQDDGLQVVTIRDGFEVFCTIIYVVNTYNMFIYIYKKFVQAQSVYCF